MLAWRSRTAEPAIDGAPPPAAAARQVPASSGRAGEAVPPASRRRRIGGAVLALVGIAGVAALLEWAGWRILWRHGGGPPELDRAWRIAFLAGTVRTMLGALGTGAGVAVVVRALAAARAWEAWPTRRRVARAFAAGVIAFLALLAALTLGAP